jgi:hypothetical protein
MINDPKPEKIQYFDHLRCCVSYEYDNDQLTNCILFNMGGRSLKTQNHEGNKSFKMSGSYGNTCRNKFPRKLA